MGAKQIHDTTYKQKAQFKLFLRLETGASPNHP